MWLEISVLGISKFTESYSALLLNLLYHFWKYKLWDVWFIGHSYSSNKDKKTGFGLLGSGMALGQYLAFEDFPLALVTQDS